MKNKTLGQIAYEYHFGYDENGLRIPGFSWENLHQYQQDKWEKTATLVIMEYEMRAMEKRKIERIKDENP